MENLQRLVLHFQIGPTENRRELQRITENFEFPHDFTRRRGDGKTTPNRPQMTPDDPLLFVRSWTLEILNYRMKSRTRHVVRHSHLTLQLTVSKHMTYSTNRPLVQSVGHWSYPFDSKSFHNQLNDLQWRGFRVVHFVSPSHKIQFDL